MNYSTLHSGEKSKKSPKISDESDNLTGVKSPSQHEQDLHAEIANELRALEAQEAKLRMDLAVAEKKRQIRALQAKIQQVVDSLTVARQTPKVVQTEKSGSPQLPARKQKVTLKDLSKNKDLKEAQVNKPHASLR